MTKIVTFQIGIDYDLLRVQKENLLEVMGTKHLLSQDQHDALQGIIHMIDAIQDASAKTLGDRVVFGRPAKVSPDNKLWNIIDFDACKLAVDTAAANKERVVILVPHYSINVQSKYEDGEQLQWDLDELQGYLGHMVEVTDFDDLVVDFGEEDDPTDLDDYKEEGLDKDNEAPYLRGYESQG